MMIALTALLTIAAGGHAMSYEQARNEALFLTDKMAYELNLTAAQYEAVYEINLDYLMGVTSYDDVYGTYWERRNLDLSYVLLDWQWSTFVAASYFYRPLYWRDGYWHFGIYARYPHRDYFFFGRPVFYASYRGGHAWHAVGGRGYYYGRREHFRPIAGRSHFGMHDRWKRGDFHHIGGHRHIEGSRPGHVGGGIRNSSTRTTVNQDRHHGNTGDRRLGNAGDRRLGDTGTWRYGQGGRYGQGSRYGQSGQNGQYGQSGRYGQSGQSGWIGSGSRARTTTTNTEGRSSGSFGGGRSSGSFGGSRSSGSFGSGRSAAGTSSGSGGYVHGGRR